MVLGFTSDARHELWSHRNDAYWGEYLVKRGYKLSFNDFDCDVVRETFQSNLHESMMN